MLCQARLPVGLDVSVIPIAPADPIMDVHIAQTDFTDRCNAFVQLACRRQEASDNIKVAQKKQKRHHDANVKPQSFKIGENSGEK